MRKLVVVTKAASRGDAERCFDYPNHAGNRKEDRITEDYKPYAIRMKEARAEARAQRKAEKAAWKRMIALDVECRRMALQIVKDEIRASGRKWTDYSTKELNQRAEAIAIGPWLVLKAQARVDQILQVMSKSERPAPQAVSMHRTHAQNEAAQ